MAGRESRSARGSHRIAEIIFHFKAAGADVRTDRRSYPALRDAERRQFFDCPRRYAGDRSAPSGVRRGDGRSAVFFYPREEDRDAVGDPHGEDHARFVGDESVEPLVVRRSSRHAVSRVRGRHVTDLVRVDLRRADHAIPAVPAVRDGSGEDPDILVNDGVGVFPAEREVHLFCRRVGADAAEARRESVRHAREFKRLRPQKDPALIKHGALPYFTSIILSSQTSGFSKPIRLTTVPATDDRPN